MRKGKGDTFMKTVYVCFYLSNGYAGCHEERYIKETFSDDISDEIIDNYINDMYSSEVYEYLETYSYIATGWGEGFESEEDREDYYSGEYCNWEYITEEEFLENVDEE